MKCACPPRHTHAITVEEPTYTQDATNAQIASWGTYATIKGTPRGEAAREVVQSEQVQGVRVWIVEVDATPTAMAITSPMRLKFRYRGFSVTADCDGPGSPMYPKVGRYGRLKIRAMEQTA